MLNNINKESKNLGVVTPVPSDKYDISTSYQKLNIVSYLAGCYMAKKDNIGVVPGTTTNWQNYWMLLFDINDIIAQSIPTKTSELVNDSGFITNAVTNLANYYLKTETYTKNEINNLINAIKTTSFERVDSLPSVGDTNIIYLVPSISGGQSNIYDEYIYINNIWELIGSTAIDLTQYQLRDDNSLLTTNKNVVGAINEVFNGLQSIDGIKTIEPDENGVYNFIFYNYDDGIYYLPQGTKIYTHTNNSYVKITTTQSTFCNVGTQNNNKHYIVYFNNRIWIGTGSGNKTVDFTNVMYINQNQTVSGVKTFSAQPKMTATLEQGDNSTNIPTTAWVQNEKSAIYRHILTVNFANDYGDQTGKGYFYSVNSTTDTYEDYVGLDYFDIKAVGVLSEPYLVTDGGNNVLKSFITCYPNDEMPESYNVYQFFLDNNSQITSISEVVEKV